MIKINNNGLKDDLWLVGLEFAINIEAAPVYSKLEIIETKSFKNVFISDKESMEIISNIYSVFETAFLTKPIRATFKYKDFEINTLFEKDIKNSDKCFLTFDLV